MTDLNTMTKAAINALLVTPLTASQLKKKSHADLVAMFDAMPTADALDADLRDARPDDTSPTPKKTRVLDDRILIKPGKADDVKPTKEGSKRALLIQALSRGTTLEHLMELLGWNRDTVSSAIRTDVGAIGLGVERRDSKYFLLLPEGMSALPVRKATATREDARQAACK